MNSLTFVTIATILIAMGPLALTLYQTASAQYTTGQDTGLGVEEQLRLAKEKVAQVQQSGQGASSGVPIIGKNLGDVAVFGGAIVAIFGAVAAAFILMSRGKRAVKA